MATSSTKNRGYAELPGSSGSLANRPTTFAGGVRRRDESFRDRMDTGRAGNAAPQAAPLSRRDNILAARADGTFNQKRDAYNAAGAATGHSMDEAGNIVSAQGAGVSQPPSGPPSPNPPVPSSPNPAAAPLPANLRRPAAPRAPGFIDGKPAGQTLAALKGPQTTPPMAGAQQPVGGGGFKMPSVAAALRPPTVTRNVTSPSRVTSPVTPQAAPGGMMATAGRMAQHAAGALTAPNPALVMPRAQATLQTLQSRGQQRWSPTPQGVPAAASTFTNQQADRYNTAMASIAAPPPSVLPTPTPPKPVAASIAGPSSSHLAPPNYLQRKMAANPEGIFAKTAEASGMLKKSIKTGVNNIENAAKAAAPLALAPGVKASSLIQHANTAIGKTFQKQITKNPQGIFSRLAGARAEGGPVSAGKPYLVGEKGPEIVVPKQDATVIPNHQLTPGSINPNADPLVGLNVRGKPPVAHALNVRGKPPVAHALNVRKHTGRDWRPSNPRPGPAAGSKGFRPPVLAPNLLVAR